MAADKRTGLDLTGAAKRMTADKIAISQRLGDPARHRRLAELIARFGNSIWIGRDGR